MSVSQFAKFKVIELLTQLKIDDHSHLHLNHSDDYPKYPKIMLTTILIILINIPTILMTVLSILTIILTPQSHEGLYKTILKILRNPSKSLKTPYNSLETIKIPQYSLESIKIPKNPIRSLRVP